MTAFHSRRAILSAAGALGLTVGFVGRPAQAAASGDLSRKKLVVVICRGGMDGLSATPPVGDPDYVRLRGAVAIPADQALKLDGDFALHPALASVHALALKGQARIAPAIASPDRARSHFEAQDVLETGAAQVYGASSGWLNRALEASPADRKVAALSVGAVAPLILRGKVQAASWSPGKGFDETARLPTILQDLYKLDPLLGPAFARGLETEVMAQAAMTAMPVEPAAMSPPTSRAPTAASPANQRQGREAARKLGSTLAGFMSQAEGPQIAAVSLDGWDTHAGQLGQVAVRLAYLDAVLDGLNTGLGTGWNDTMVLVVTEFGRTARINGTGGSDHGTGSSALVLGGGLKRGGIIGDWPGLTDAALYENRDVRPSLDLRSLFKGALADHMGMDPRVLDTTVFPDSGAARPLTGLV
jgi:uncharacterized protein (DUF1501 family)